MPSNTLLQQTGSQMLHRCCPIANKVENIDRWQVCRHTQPPVYDPQKSTFQWGIYLNCIIRWAPASTHLKRHLTIGSAVLAQLTLVTSRQTDRPRCTTFYANLSCDVDNIKSTVDTAFDNTVCLQWVAQ